MSALRSASTARRQNRARLGVQTLEGRDVPAVILDLTTAGSSATASGAIIQQTGPVASGEFNTFLSVQNNGTEQGYNTDARPFQQNQVGDLTVTHSLLLSDIPTVTIGTTVYREFVLDVTQTSKKPLIFLTDLQIFLGSTGTMTGYNAKANTLAGQAAVYDLDSAADYSVKLNWALNGAAGPGDAYVLIPDSLFSGGNFVYLYSKFSSANDGAESWGVRPVAPPPPPSGVLSGYVYFDADNDGVREPDGNQDLVNEVGIEGVTMHLTGTDDLGQAVDITVLTDVNGYYSFSGLRAGTYAVTKVADPPDYIDGINTPGMAGNGQVQESNSDPNIPDMIYNISLGTDQTLTEYNFGEIFVGGGT